ncbi:MAG: 3-phosphoshikimate 1-carboxyvinyltransferase [Phycisphaerae bacterium]|nr:3-phosphoshikimate 1-carboxyvinyltransferase [Phycisphaerae bacterium]
MNLTTRRSTLRGRVFMPGSKSHTIRAVAIASLAEGESTITAPMVSQDTRSAAACYRAMGAEIDTCRSDVWRVKGLAGRPLPPENVIDVENSGTTLRVAVGSAALVEKGLIVFTGDEQIRRRPIAPLLEALVRLGARAETARGNGCAPLVVGPRLTGGRTTLEAVTSQYLSSLLINCPLARDDTEITVTVLNEAPYVQITLDWLDAQGIAYERKGLTWFRIKGGQSYRAFERRIPADFSSATFFLCAGAMADADIVVSGLDMNDTQGDKAVADYLRSMGANIEVTDEGIHVSRGDLRGTEIDLNATPDALPAMAVVGCLARGTTRLVNVPQARLKETDRIQVMAAELGKLGARCEELPDGLVIHESKLHGGHVHGHGDHRVVMALSLAGLVGDEPVTIDTAEAVDVTFPEYADLMRSVGADLTTA